LLAEGLAIHAGLPRALSGIQMNVGGINLLADLAVMRAFKKMMWSEFLIVVPETFQNPPADLIAEQAHFARMAISAKLGGANFYRPKAAENIGIPTGASMAKAIWASQNVFDNTASIAIKDPEIDHREAVILTEAMAVLASVLGLKELHPEEIKAEFWLKYGDMELIDLIVTAGKKGILDAPNAGGWDLKRGVKTHRDKDGIKRYVPGYGPDGISEDKLTFTQESVKVEGKSLVTQKEKVLLATVGADAHVVGINMIREAFEQAGYEVIYLRGMNLPETVAEVAAEAKVDVVGVSNLLGLGQILFNRVEHRLKELRIRDNVVLMGGGRIAEKEEEHAEVQEKIKNEGTSFLGVDGFFGPGTDPQDVIVWVRERVEGRKK
jgi:2-methyleneglutarate mutase